MFTKIDKDTIVNTDRVSYFHEETRILKLASGETFQVDPEYIPKLKRDFSYVNFKQKP